MMEQIVKRKKKGRPPKADRGTRDPPPPPPPPPQQKQQPENDLRRSLRRRNVKYVFDLDDYFDDDDLFTDDENRSRREKKLEQLLKLQAGSESESTAPQRSRFRRVYHAPAASVSSSEDDDGDKPSKKRRINGYLDRDSDDDDNDYPNEEDNYNEEEEEEEEVKIRARKPDFQAEESPPGTPAERPSGLPLPDKRALELILDKLQKKDIYGVYAEPVDPEELPDYHDIIEHPMDFTTVRNKLGNGSYATFEQFERDVFLICSNAMQYNAPDTVYYKHARTIQELAKRKFEKLKLKMECMEKNDFKPEQKSRPASTLKKQIKSPIGRQMVQEPVGSDFSSGATLATAGDDHTVSNALQQPDIVDGPAEDNSFGNDSNLDKMEESLPGKGQSSRIGRKPSLVDENRRATYAISLSEVVVSPDSIFSTFDGETKHLVPVGLYADHSYARSLAHFAATLGSVAWRVASKRIEEALPQGCKFGKGWVGEYEPLPTPVLMLKNRPIKEPPYFAKVQPTAHPKTLENTPTNLISESQATLPCFNPPVSKTRAPVITVPTVGNNIPEKKAPFFLSPGARLNCLHNQSFQSRDFSETNNNSFPRHIESNGVPSVHKNSADLVGSRQIPRTSEAEASRSPRNKSFPPPEPFIKKPDASGPAFQRVPDGKIANNYPDLGRSVSYYPHHEPGPGLSDPVQQMRQLSEKARQNQHKLPNQSSPNAPQMLSPSLKFTGNDPNNAALSAARAWMSMGSGGFRPTAENLNKIHSGSLNNSTREMHSQAWRLQGEFHAPPRLLQQQHTQEKNISNISPVYGFVGQGQMPVMVGGNQMVQLQNQRLVFPQLAGSDLMMHPPAWRGISHQMELRQKQDNFPPDLNIGFQSSGSPVQPSSGVLLDSQQPDLALQL
ncbi:DNA-binding bromodomain-containing protein [Striga hermonthica]|uniref:DNA-binding bromodomain-containing protein n=1 Tax=Striga hermonthica TaxID=68872 RepID=A0A9N7MR73_STRHE|nr:DNA-binding bromodomain-containing protein [Striga hermonthica]